MAGRLLEICIDSVASALTAQAGGADRVELCDNLVEGGTTPSYGMIKAVRSQISIGLMVMIRPRGGDFLYSPEEFEIMKSDIEMAKQLGADGVVFGLLNPDGTIDKTRTKELIELSRPMQVAFHRAFDMVKDGQQALEDLIEIGCDRVLTSGLHPEVISGQEIIKQLIQQADGRIAILCGGGIRLDNIQSFVQYTNAPEIHGSGRKTVHSQMTFQNDQIAMGAIPNSEYITKVADEETVRKFRELID